MISRFQRVLPIRNRPLVVFVVAVVLPGIALALAGLRNVRQERFAAERQARERVERGADQAVRALTQELQWWQDRLDEIPLVTTFDLNLFPTRVRNALETPGAAVLLKLEKDKLQVFPPDQLLYRLNGMSDPAPPPAALLKEDDREVRTKNYAESMRDYRRLLATNSDAAVRPWLLQRLARVAEKAGFLKDALNAYRELGRDSGAMLGSLPAGLIAGFGICSLLRQTGPGDEFALSTLGFHRALASGRWQLDKVRYRFYSETARGWLEQAMPRTEEIRGSLQLEDRKRLLTEGVEALLGSWNSGSMPLPSALESGVGPHLAFWHPVASPPQAIGFLLSADYARRSVWPRIFADSGGEEVFLALKSPDGKLLFLSPESPPLQNPGPPLAVSRGLQEHGYLWRLDAWPRRPETLQSGFQRRQWLYLGTIALILASLVFGIYISARTLQKQLEVARLKSEFVSSVSHEFQSPLAGIRQLAELLATNRVPSEERKSQYFRMILHESERLSGLVENVLGIARIEEKGSQFNFELVDPSPWLRDVIDLFRQSPAAQGASMVATVSDALPALSIDREALARAICNLLDNAIKYSPDCRKVWIEAEAEREHVVIRVRDEGIGISPDDQKHIYERFYRGRNPLARRVHGTGLGLSLVREVVTAHQGELTFSSQPQVGTTFSIRLKQAGITQARDSL